jgi:hypothetical protein
VIQSKKKAKPYRTQSRYGILNPSGDIWSPETFDHAEAAKAYLKRFWSDFPKEYRDVSRFKIVRVRVTVSAVNNQ